MLNTINDKKGRRNKTKRISENPPKKVHTKSISQERKHYAEKRETERKKYAKETKSSYFWGPENWISKHRCSAKGTTCNNYEKNGH